MAGEHGWRLALPPPLWKSLIGLVALALIPVGALWWALDEFWPNVTTSTVAVLSVVCFVLAIPLWVWMLQPKKK